jgi:hypothetical protein
MNNGEISGNHVKNAASVNQTGGGVMLVQSATFTMNGGSITGNSIDGPNNSADGTSAYGIGGGVST